MKSLIKLLAFVLGISFIALTACKQATAPGDATDESDKLSIEDIQAQVEEVLFPMPDPLDLYEMLEEIGAVYVGEFLNAESNYEKYFTESSQAINLGVYGADLSYSTVYDQKKEMDIYTGVLKKAIDDLGVKIDYSYLISEDGAQKVTNKDSLITLTTNIFYDVYEFLNKEGDPAMAALMANGFYIESLYIATHISEDTYNNTEMVKLIFDQSKALENIIELNEKFDTNEQLQSIQGALKKLKAIYDATEDSLNQEQLNDITATIEAIRESVVS